MYTIYLTDSLRIPHPLSSPIPTFHFIYFPFNLNLCCKIAFLKNSFKGLLVFCCCFSLIRKAVTFGSEKKKRRSFLN